MTLSYSGNPGVDDESHRGANWKRPGQAAAKAEWAAEHEAALVALERKLMASSARSLAEARAAAEAEARVLAEAAEARAASLSGELAVAAAVAGRAAAEAAEEAASERASAGAQVVEGSQEEEEGPAAEKGRRGLLGVMATAKKRMVAQHLYLDTYIRYPVYIWRVSEGGKCVYLHPSL